MYVGAAPVPLYVAQQVCEAVSGISNMVRKDVLRTDRQHPYFSGPDDNPNTTALFNILTTYVVTKGEGALLGCKVWLFELWRC